ncbi:hypothetical protein Pfo_010145 [Paulownia fortunei]|nr:hypothetical protein Pfo_010145 [Paulownia fortunei]
MSHELRKLFVIMLVYCAPTNMRVLWVTYFEAIFEDFKREPKPQLNCKVRVSFFIDESSETSKIFLYCALFAHLRSKNLIALASLQMNQVSALCPSGFAKLLCKAQLFLFIPRVIIYQNISANLIKLYFSSQMKKKNALSRNMRSRNNLNLSEFLLRVGNNEELINTKGNIKIQKDMNINAIFLALNKNDHSTHYMTSLSILVAKNEHVYKLNDKLIFLFPKEVRTFSNYDEVIDDTNNYYAKDFLNSLTQNGLSPHKMMLKRNCPIILLRYLDPSNKLCNEIVFSQHTEKHVFLPRILLFLAENNVFPFQYRFLGQMIPNVGIYLPHPVFSHDQLYIAISRGTPISILKVLIKLDTTNVREKTWTKNIIYRQVSSSSTNIFRLSNISYIINIFLLGKKQH